MPRQDKKTGRKAGTPTDTPEMREQFLTTLRQTGNVGVSAEVCGLYRTTPYQWKRKDPAFAKQWDEALDAAADIAEAEVRRRAIEGWEEPVFYQGKIVGYTRKFSDRMLELYIKALKPEKFREKQVGDGAVLIQVNGAEEMKALRESSPWSGGKSAQVEGQGAAFAPITVEVEDLQTDRAGVATNSSRKRQTKKGLTEAELYEED